MCEFKGVLHKVLPEIRQVIFFSIAGCLNKYSAFWSYTIVMQLRSSWQCYCTSVTLDFITRQYI